MFKESLILIILIIVIYQLYSINNNKEKFQKNNVEVISESSDESPDENKEIKTIKKLKNPQSKDFEHPSLGKPTRLIPEGYLYNYNIPNPWSAIVFNPHKKMNYLYVLKLSEDQNTLNKYRNLIKPWNEIISDVAINVESSELIVPSPEEDSALALSNLILSNLRGDLPMKNIIENNLIQISISKIRNYSSVKTKIKEQILENLANTDNSGKKEFDYEEDLAETATAPTPPDSPKNSNEVNPLAYEGGEFSYL